MVGSWIGWCHGHLTSSPLGVAGGQKSKKSDLEWFGRSDTDKPVVFPIQGVPDDLQPGDYVAVHIENANAATLRGRAVAKTSLQEFAQRSHGRMFLEHNE